MRELFREAEIKPTVRQVCSGMTLGNMRANGVRSLDVSCWQCHHRAILSAGGRMRYRCRRSDRGWYARAAGSSRRRTAELAGTATAREPDRGAMAVSEEQRRALRSLAGLPLGATEAIMLAHGFTNAGRTGDGGTPGNEGGTAADYGDLVGDHRCRAGGTRRMMPWAQWRAEGRYGSDDSKKSVATR